MGDEDIIEALVKLISRAIALVMLVFALIMRTDNMAMGRNLIEK